MRCLFITANLSVLLQSPDSDQYHSQLPWNIVALVHLNAISYLSICDQSGCETGDVQVYVWMFRRRNIVLFNN